MKPINKLFLIDDDEIFSFLTHKIIENTNRVEEIQVFKNGLEVWDYFEENYTSPDLLPDVILLDLNMPIMDGWQFLEKYATLSPQIEKKIKIYVLSSSIHPKDVDSAKSLASVADYLIKPVTLDSLTEVLDRKANQGVYP